MAVGNNISWIGRVCRDPELRTLTSGDGKESSVCNISLARNRNTKKDSPAEFMNVTLWNSLATLTSNYVKKGDRIGVNGELHSREFTRKDGTPGKDWYIEATNVEFLSQKQSTSQDHEFEPDSAEPSTDRENSRKTNTDSESDSSLDEDDLPF